MLTRAQAKLDFLKLIAIPHGNIVTLGFNGSTVQALKGTERTSVDISSVGEIVGDTFTLRCVYDAFVTMPAEKDIVTVDGVEHQVGAVSFAGFGAVCRIIIFDEDA